MVFGDLGIETGDNAFGCFENQVVVAEGEEGTDHPHRATLQENETRQGTEMNGRMGDGFSCHVVGWEDLSRQLTAGEDTHRRNDEHCGEE